MSKSRNTVILSQGKAASRSSPAVLLLWIGDAVAAILFATALALTAQAILDSAGTRVAVGAMSLVLARALRGALQFAATTSGQRAAATAKRSWRQRIYPPLLQAAPGSRTMLGEAIADAVDRVEDIDGYHARVLPLRRAAALAGFR